MTGERINEEDRVRDEFINHVKVMVDYWNEVDLKKSRGDMEDEQKERLSGLAFSILTALDGGSGGLPPYEVKPLYDECGNEYTEESPAPDIAGVLHEVYCDNEDDD